MADDPKKPRGVVLRTLTEEERAARAHALADLRLREVEERKAREEQEKRLDVSGKTLTLKPRTETGIVRQSFSHGRSKSIVIEKVKRRAIPTQDERDSELISKTISGRRHYFDRRKTDFSEEAKAQAFADASARVDQVRSTKAQGLFLADLSALERLPPMDDLREVRGLNIANTLVSDLTPVARLSNLSGLNCYNTPVSDLSPLRRLKKLRFLRIEGTQVSDLSPIAETTRLVVGARGGYGLEFENCFLEDLSLWRTSKVRNPSSTLDAISYIRNLMELPPLDVEALEIQDRTEWADRVAQLRQVPFGARFIQHDGTFSIDAAGDDTDTTAATEPLTSQLHDGVKRKAEDFSGMAKRVDNQPGWTGLGKAAEHFATVVDCDTADIPLQIGKVYEATIALASFLELDTRVRKAPAGNADPLDPEVQRAFADLIRTAGPWVRRFPTARMLDDEAGAFLTRPDLYGPAAEVIEVAEATNLISSEDAQLLQSVIDAAKRGEFQGQKAGARSIWSSKNLVTAVAMVLSFEAGLINNKAAETSLIAQRGAQFYMKAEKAALKLFEDAPDDIRQALQAMVEDIKKPKGPDPANLPETPSVPTGDRRNKKRGD